MKRVKISAFAAVLSIAAAVHAAVGIGDAPELKFKAITGETIDLQRYRGRLVVVDFWSVSDLSRDESAEARRIE